MRGKHTLLTLAALALTALATTGCGNDDRASGNGRQVLEPAYAPNQAQAPRVNLHPLASPPPGSGQPFQGYAPTRITSSGPDYDAYAAPYGGGFADAGPSVQGPGYSNVAYGPGAPDPFPGAGGMPFRTPTGYCTVEDVTAYSDPMVPIGNPPIIVNTPTGGVAYGRGYQDPVPGGLIYGQVEGTADIAVPLSALDGSGSMPPAGTGAYGGGYQGTTRYAPPMGGSVAAPQPSPAVYQAPAAYPPPAPFPSPAPTGYAPPLSSTSPAPVTGAGSALPASPGLSGMATTGSFMLVPAPDVPPGNHPNDAGPSQWFEVIRPGNGPIRIGRVSSTCVCVGVRVPNRYIAAGERALIEARIVSRPQVNNLTYGIYVTILEPIQTVVDADVTIRL